MNSARDDTRRFLSTAFLEAHPREAAVVLERLAPQDAASVLDAVSPEVAAPVLDEMASPAAGDCLLSCDRSHAGRILVALPPNESVRLLRGLETEERATLMAETPDDLRDVLAVLLQHPENTAGAWMDPRVVSLPEDLTIAEARKHARRQIRFLRYYVYVTRRDQILIGTITLRELMEASSGDRVGDIARRSVERIATSDSRTTILTHPGWRRLHAMPVVDERGRLAGVIRYETFRELEAGRDVERPRETLSLAVALGELYWLGATSVTRQLFEALSRPTTKIATKEEGDV